LNRLRKCCSCVGRREARRCKKEEARQFRDGTRHNAFSGVPAAFVARSSMSQRVCVGLVTTWSPANKPSLISIQPSASTPVFTAVRM
jgi:hypothetical protein